MPGNSNIGYLERGLWRSLFKLEHVSPELALALPSRALIASSILLDQVAYPSSLGEVTRRVASGDLGFGAVNRVPYEIPEKQALAFHDLDVKLFAPVIRHLESLLPLVEYHEGGAYNPGMSMGGISSLMVTRDGTITRKTYIWDTPKADYTNVLGLYKRQQQLDPDWIDKFGGAVTSDEGEELEKRFGFLEACVVASQRDGTVPVLRSSGSLLSLLQDFFPERIKQIDLLRLLQLELPRCRLTAEELAVARDDARIRQIRASLRKDPEGVDPDEVIDTIVGVLRAYLSGRESARKETRCSVELEGNWPNSQAEKFPRAQDMADCGDRNVLYFWSVRQRQPVCIGCTVAFFEPY